MFFGMSETGGELRISVYCRIECSQYSIPEHAKRGDGMQGQEQFDRKTYPRHLSFEKSVEYMLIGKNGMPSDSVEKSLQHPFPASDHGNVFLRLSLFDCVVSNSLF